MFWIQNSIRYFVAAKTQRGPELRMEVRLGDRNGMKTKPCQRLSGFAAFTQFMLTIMPQSEPEEKGSARFFQNL